MKPLILKLIIILVAVALIVPTALMAYDYYQKVNTPINKNPFDYIPGNSNMVATINKNNSLFYVFDDNNSYGIVANISYNIVPSNSTTILAPSGGSFGNVSHNVTVKTLIYDKTEVYEVQNVNLSSILKSTVNTTLGSLSANNTTNVFVYLISNKYVVMGQENAINASIYAHMNNNNAMKLEPYLNLNINTSIYYNLSGLSVLSGISAKFLTVNVTQNQSLLNIYMNSKIMPYELELLKIAFANANYSSFGNLSLNLSHPQISSHNNVLSLKYNISSSQTEAVFKTLNIKT